MSLPDEMEMFIDDGNMLSPVCCESAGQSVATIGETTIPIDIFIIEPCACKSEDENFKLN